MSCVSPVSIFVNGQSFLVPCNHCMNCRITKQSQYEFLATKELLYQYSLGRGASFVTLTYSDDNVPLNSKGFLTLDKTHLTLFNKRCRRDLEYYHIPLNYKFFACGEYGDKFQRPHMHIVFLGLDDVICKKIVFRNWKYGLSDVGPLSNGGLRYVLKYCSKSDVNASSSILYKSNDVELPFIRKSVAMGRYWLDCHLNDIVHDKFLFLNNGFLSPYPKYVCRYVSDKTGVDYRPFLSEFYNFNSLSTCPSGLSVSDFNIEKSLIREKYLIDAARSKGIVVNPSFISSRHWLKPSTVRFSPDNSLLASLALE